MKDFTLKTFTTLLSEFKKAGYEFQTFEEFLLNPGLKSIILRHDVDRLAANSLAIAKIEMEFEIKGSFYFRIGKESNQPDIIRQIRNMGHEIGYHYEDLTLSKGNFEEAYQLFLGHLNYFRQFYPVRTICMHGSPLSKWDSRNIWKEYDYKTIGLIGEPYFDINFSQVLYLTDTGRRWDGSNVSIRDKELKNGSDFLSGQYSFHSTGEIIRALQVKRLPDQLMMTFHPQRWSDNIFDWTQEYILQNLKNQLKRALIKNK